MDDLLNVMWLKRKAGLNYLLRKPVVFRIDIFKDVIFCWCPGFAVLMLYFPFFSYVIFIVALFPRFLFILGFG